MNKIAFVFLVFMITTGCDSYVQHFVGSEAPTPTPDAPNTSVPGPLDPMPTENQNLGPQMNAGAMAISGSLHKTQPVLNTRGQVLSGSQVKAVVNFDQAPTQ